YTVRRRLRPGNGGRTMHDTTDAPSADDLLARAEENGFELIDGQLVEKPMGAKSSRVGARLIGRLDPFTEANGLGEVFNSECGYQIFGSKKKVRKPDVSFVARGRLREVDVPDGHLTVPPDLAVEVVSPNDMAEDIDQRVVDYLGAGVRLMWVIYPKTRSVVVFRQDGSGARLNDSQDLSGEDVIPGFTCPVQALFPRLSP